MGYIESLENRRVLVTGANGFVGSHLVNRLVKNDADVVAFVRATSKTGSLNLQDVSDDIEILRGDLQDPTSVREAVSRLSDYEDTLVFHLGAQAHVAESWERPGETLRTNVLGTLNLLEAIRLESIDVNKINVAGTSEEYGDVDKNCEEFYSREKNSWLLDEKSPLNPESIYGTSKVAADFLASNYAEAYGIPSLTTRMFNNFGPRQSPRYITGTVITQALSREKIELGNLKPKRDMMYIEDGVEGHIQATLHGEPGERYNFGSGRSISMRDWVELILQIGKKEGYWQEKELVQSKDRYRPGESEVQELKADYSKLKELTGWEPSKSREEGLRETIRWYAENKKRWTGLTDWR